MAHLTESIHINAPAAKVHAIAADPHKWSTWFVGLGEAESIEGDNSPGTVVKHKYLVSGVHVPITTKVTDNRAGDDGSFFWRADNEGGFAGWHTWSYEPRGEGTLVSVEMEYEVPGSVLGKVADRLFVERNQQRALRHTLENLKELSES